jgi:hypothetical protein
MTVRIDMLLELLEDDRELLELLVECGVLPPGADTCSEDQVSDALVARTLYRELEVNPPGVEIILRMRGEMLAMRRQVAEILRLLAESGRAPPSSR